MASDPVAPPPPRHLLALPAGGWVVVLAFLVRLLWVLMVPSRPVGDFAVYREAAEHLLDQGRLDSEFVYMPGYVILLAGARMFGGGLLAAKMIGVVAGTVTAAASGGIAAALFGRRAGVLATALAALWPAGIAVSSVLGTDMPASALGGLAIWALVRFGPGRPWLAATLCGCLLGLAAWVRAVAAPLAALSVLYWLALGTRAPAALARAGLALALAFVILLPWGLRNQGLYGELFFTDSHGGNTALVGANPNSEGTYSRSLNLMFARGTGYRVFETPALHRESDRVAYRLARDWTTFEPLYAVGLLIAKADRLLTHERNLLYWPIFRQGVLDDAQRAFFDRHRAALERTCDLFWWLLAALAVAGVALCLRWRRWAALAVLTFPLALIAIYTMFFAEVRYHLAIAPLLIPYAAYAAEAGWAGARHRDAPAAAAAAAARTWVPAASAAGVALAMFALWSGVIALGSVLRARHRWAVAVCAYPEPEQMHLCSWRRVLPTGGPSPVRGAWDGVGVGVGQGFSPGVMAAVRTVIPVAAGRYRVRALVSASGGAWSQGGLAIALRAEDRIIARVVSPSTFAAPAPATATGRDDEKTSGDAAAPTPMETPLEGMVDLTGGPLVLEVQVEPAGIRSIADGAIIWITELVVQRSGS